MLPKPDKNNFLHLPSIFHNRCNYSFIVLCIVCQQYLDRNLFTANKGITSNTNRTRLYIVTTKNFYIICEALRKFKKCIDHCIPGSTCYVFLSFQVLNILTHCLAVVFYDLFLPCSRQGDEHHYQ